MIHHIYFLMHLAGNINFSRHYTITRFYYLVNLHHMVISTHNPFNIILHHRVRESGEQSFTSLLINYMTYDDSLIRRREVSKVI